MIVIYWILVIFGSLLTAVTLYNDSASESLFSTAYFAFIFVILGAFGIWYKKHEYKGGTTSVVGLIQTIIWVFFLISFIEASSFAKEDILLFLGKTLVTLGFGAPLLIAGHKIHIERSPRS